MGHRSVWIVILVALLTATRTATSYSHEEVPRPKALSGLRLNFHLSQTSEESTDSKPVCKVRIRSCTPGHMPPRHKPPTATLLLTVIELDWTAHEVARIGLDWNLVKPWLIGLDWTVHSLSMTGLPQSYH